jgi:hypothetical protein
MSPINWAALRPLTAREIVNALLCDGFSLRSLSRLSAPGSWGVVCRLPGTNAGV